MNNFPLLTIITINYNNLEGLKRTFESVFNQTYQEFEYIIIDGGSSDGSKALIEENKDKFNYWVSEKDKGIYNAMNKGILAAKGEYLLFLNSGDHLFSNETLKNSVKYIQNKSKDIYYGNIVNRDQYQDEIVKYAQKLTFKFFFDGSLPHPASFIKRVCFLESDYDEELKIVSDWKFFIVGIFKKNYSFQYFDETVAVYYLDGISSVNKELDTIEREKILKLEFPLFYDDYLEYQLLKYYFKKYRLDIIKKGIVSLKNRIGI